LALAAISGFAWALFVATDISSGSTAQIFADGTLTKLLTETRFGQVWLWRSAFLLATALLLLSADRRATWIRLISASAFLAAIACVGHSGAQVGAIGWLQLAADVAHLFAAGLWLGSLPALALLLASRGFAKSSNATRRFSSFGIVAVMTLLLTGLFNTYLLTDGIASLPDSTYGRLLLLKVAVFTGMVALATINRCYWTPKLPGRAAMTAIRRYSAIEAAMGLAVLGIVGVLGTLPPPVHAHLHASAGDEGTFVHIHDSRGMAEVRLVPGVPGQNDAEIRLMQEDFSPLTAKSVELQLSLPGQPAIAAGATAVGDGLWRVSGLALPAAGVWSVVVVIGRQGIAPLALDGPIVVDPGSAQKSE
jgi:putative copper export protein